MASLVKTRTPPPQAQFDELLIWVLICLLYTSHPFNDVLVVRQALQTHHSEARA